MYKRYLLAATFFIIPFNSAIGSESSKESFSLAKEYTDFKNWIQNKTNIDYSLDISYTAQFGTPNGGKTIYQTMYSPSITWNMFNSDKYGSGTLNFMFTRVQYWSAADGNTMGNNLNMATEINDYMDNSSTFNQLSYTQGLMNNKLQITIGQYPLWLFDGGSYDSNQQTGFINESLSQNASSTYPDASMGGYVTWNPTDTLSFTAGTQDARNIDGSRISISNLDEGDWTGFGYVSWSPKIEGLGSSQFTLLYYNQPSVPAQIGNSQGWSFNFSQNINDTWGIFGRFNTVTGNIEPISSSIVLGGVMNNPLGRNPIDQIGLAISFNEINENAVTPNKGTKVGNAETVVEGYWNWGFSEYMMITPDIQLYFNPALDTKKNFAATFALRLTFML